MKKIFLFALVALSAMFTACSDSDNSSLTTDENGNIISDGTPRYLSVNIGSPYVSSRAEVYKEANPVVENAIRNLCFYFFDASGKSIEVNPGFPQSPAVPASTKYYVGPDSLKKVGQALQNIDMKYNAVVAVNIPKGGKIPSQMVVIANYGKDEAAYPTISAGTSISDLYKIVDNYSVSDGALDAVAGKVGDTENVAGAYLDTSKDAATGLKMASSVYTNDADGTKLFCPAKIGTSLYSNVETAKANPVLVYVERVNAKVSVKTEITAAHTFTVGENQFPTYDTGVDIDLSSLDLTDAELTQLRTDLYLASDATSIDVWVKFEKWYVTAQMPKSYLFKNINTQAVSTWPTAFSTWTPGTTSGSLFTYTDWNKEEYFRSFWAMNPRNDDSTPYDLTKSAHQLLYNNWNNNSTATGYITNGKSQQVGTNYNDVLYIQENAADYSSGKKIKGDDDTEAVGFKGDNRYTKVVVAATIGYKDKDNEFRPLNYAEWGGLRFILTEHTKEKLAATVILGNNFSIYKKVVNGSETTYKQISYEDIEVVTSSGSVASSVFDNSVTADPVAPNNLAESQRYNCYLKLKTGDSNEWYSKKDNPQESDKLTTNQIKEQLNAATAAFKVWNGGKCYYSFPIQHLNVPDTYSTMNAEAKTQAEAAAGFYGVVRNHIYQCNIKTLMGFGTPVYSPEEIIVPEVIDDQTYYIAAQINVLTWRVVEHDYELK